jgi:hypothetical protein
MGPLTGLSGLISERLRLAAGNTGYTEIQLTGGEEDSPHEMGQAIADWLASIDADQACTRAHS